MRLARLSVDAAGAGVSTPWCIPALPPSEPQPLRRPNPTTAGSVGADAPYDLHDLLRRGVLGQIGLADHAHQGVPRR